MNYKTLDDVERVLGLGKSQEVIDLFVSSYLQGLEQEAWLDRMKADHASIYPKQIPNPEYVAPLPQKIVNPEWSVATEDIPYWISNPDYVDPVAEFIDNEEYITFDAYIEETVEVITGHKDIYNEDGIDVIGQEPIYEDQLIREFVEVPIDVEAWKVTSELYKSYRDTIKDNKLNRLTVTISTGKVFYADPTSRSDLTDAVLLGQMNSVPGTTWKLAEEFEGQRIVFVTIQELAEAAYLALESKGQIVGAI